MLNPLVSYFKISSSDITNFPLLKKIASKNKPVLLSTGASSMMEIKDAINFLRKNKCNKIVIMHCILNYPTLDEDANLGMIKDLKKEFPDNVIGYSDHTLPNPEMQNIVIASALGAKVIEKHFTLNKKLKGNDHYHSMDFNDLKNLRKRLTLTKKILGKSNKTYLKSEINSRKFARRSLVCTKDLTKNYKITKIDIICKRPGTGISPIDLKKIIGKRLKKNVKEDHILQWADFKK